MKWETIIGLEVHAELSTKTKIFCGCSTEFGKEENTQICEICTGMPGTLPVLNRKVLEFAIKTGLALNCDITRKIRFDRKNYFYPDLPKAYQISQLYLPVCRNGYINIDTDTGTKKIRIHEIHMEEDAGKLIHGKDAVTLVDYNRCGIPLIEIVSEADFRNADEVISYIEKLRQILSYIGVCDCKMQEGSLRADINLSVKSTEQSELGTRTEMKNLNSLHEIRRAIEYESRRQINILENFGEIIQQTRRWDSEKGISIAMRSKENANDYKYFPEPDLPPVCISDAMTDEIRNSLPELPNEKKLRYSKAFGLSEYDTKLLTEDIFISRFFESTVQICEHRKEVANWITGELLRLLKEHNIPSDSIPVSPEALCKIIEMLKSSKINRTIAKQVFEKVFIDGVEPEKYIIESDLMQLTDLTEIQTIIEKVISENPKCVSDCKAGKKAAFGYLVGQSMKALGGKAPANEVRKIICKILD